MSEMKQFPVRVAPEYHEDLKVLAAREHCSINELVLISLAKNYGKKLLEISKQREAKK